VPFIKAIFLAATALALSFCPRANAADNISLNLGGGVKMDFVEIPLRGIGQKATVEIGDFTAAYPLESMKEAILYGPFQTKSGGFCYYLGKTEVTEEQWAAVMGADNKSRAPVTEISYADIVVFLEKLGAKASQSLPSTPDGKRGEVRLPREAEWEFAARGGTSATNYREKDPYKGDIKRFEIISTRTGGQFRNVGTLPPNVLGLHDMLGNVREFVDERYAESGGGRLLKGGCYTSEKSEIRSSARTEHSASAKAPFVGFRVCISAAVFTSLGQAADIREKMKSENEELARLEQRRKVAEAAAANAREEAEKARIHADLDAKRKAAEEAEGLAKEEQEKLEAVKNNLEPSDARNESQGSTSGSVKNDWNIVTHEGRRYVLVEDVATFYKMNQLATDQNSFRFSAAGWSIEYKANSRDICINGINYALCFPILSKNGRTLISVMDVVKTVEPVLRPQKIKTATAVNTVILDAGHGGQDGGASGPLGVEKDVTLDVVLRTKKLLEQNGYNVRLTRGSDEFIPIEKRQSIANEYSEAILVSVHFHKTDETGLATYALSPRGVPLMDEKLGYSDFTQHPGNERDAENIALATAMHASIIRRVRLPDRGIKRARSLEIRDVRIPAVLLEWGGIDNSSDARLLASSGFRDDCAVAITTAVNIYKQAIESKVPNANDLTPSLIGKWQGARHMVEYRPDHTWIMDDVELTPPRTWSVEGNQLSETEPEGRTTTCTIHSISNAEMVIESSEGKRYILKRVD